MRNKRNISILLFAIMLLTASCQSASPVDQSASAPLQVTVSILPQAYFVERIGGDAVEVNVMVGPGEEAHTYEPDPEQMKALSDANVFFSIGVEYEDNWLPRFEDINPNLLIVDSADGIQRIPTSEAHSHDEEEEDHDEAIPEDNLDPHVWLAPENGKIIAQNILNTLTELAPDRADTFKSNYTSLIDDIDALDANIQSSLSGLVQRKFMVFHPAWGYFADQYDVEQISVQVGGQDPSPRELADLVNLAKDEKISVIFIQPNFSTADAEAIADEIGAGIAVVDPLARDWLANLDSAAQAFADALQP